MIATDKLQKFILFNSRVQVFALCGNAPNINNITKAGSSASFSKASDFNDRN